jgi:hypothetical protein
MGRFLVAVVLLAAVVAVGPARAQEPTGLGPHAGQLMAFVGTWKLEGAVKAIEATGATDSGPISYVQVGKLVNDGAILQVQRKGTGPRGVVEELWMYRYNAVTKTYHMDASTSRRVQRNFTFTIRNHTWSFVGTNITPAGVATRERFTIAFSPDMSSATGRSEHSVDGRTWFERLTGIWTRVPTS